MPVQLAIYYFLLKTASSILDAKRSLFRYSEPYVRHLVCKTRGSSERNMNTKKVSYSSCGSDWKQSERGSFAAVAPPAYSSPSIPGLAPTILSIRVESSSAGAVPCSKITSKHRLCNSFTNTLKDSGVPGFGAFSPFTIDS